MIYDLRFTNRTIKSFTDLKVWQEGHKLVLLIYNLTKTFPKEEIYCMVNQMRRAVISVTANIAEGFGRHSYKEKIQFYYQAQGSLIELKNFLLIGKDIGYINEKDMSVMVEQSNITHQLLQGLITKSKTFLSHKS